MKKQEGYVLILTLCMLVILSILGTMALNTATTEVGISGNYRSSQLAFLAADRAVEYSMGRKEIVFSASDVNLDDTTKNYTADIRVNQSGLLPPILGGNNQVVNLGPTSCRSNWRESTIPRILAPTTT